MARAAKTDGRHQRSERSRREIVDALLKLIARGEMNPSAAQVAEEAGVGLRSVFRHFEEMDTLYRQMTAQIEDEVMPEVTASFVAKDWRGKLGEMVKRRARVFERIMPYRVAGAARRFQSEYLMQDYKRAVALEQAALRAILPKTVLNAGDTLAALDLVLSFESWRRLRQDQRLSPTRAEAAVRLAVERIVGGFG